MALLISNLNGLAYASVSKRNGLAVASIKNINGLDATGSPPAISYTTSTSDSNDLSTYTFSTQAIGTAASDRKVIVAVQARATGTTTLAVSSMTVGGISASLVS